jgi:hypothetical protein
MATALRRALERDGRLGRPSAWPAALLADGPPRAQAGSVPHPRPEPPVRHVVPNARRSARLLALAACAHLARFARGAWTRRRPRV